LIFSIIIPCYNCEKTIKRALDSVVAQTFDDYEIILVNDGSTDNTELVIKEYFVDKDVKYMYFYQENKGVAYARDFAVSNSSGKYLAFLDSDDSWHEDKLKIQYKYIKKLNTQFISVRYTYDNFISVDEIKVKRFSIKEFLISNRTSTPCTVLSRQIYDEVNGFDLNLRYSEDFNLWLKVTSIEPLVMLDVPLVKLYKNAYGESGLSSKLWEMEKGELFNYKYCYTKGYINIIQFVFFIQYSLLKYLYRVLKSSFNKKYK
jgi:glycosyltransferase involved in cell wall biosynthesis